MGYFTDYINENHVSEAIWGDVASGIKNLFKPKEKQHWLDRDIHTQQQITGRKKASEREMERKDAEEAAARFGPGNLRQALDNHFDERGDMIDQNTINRISSNKEIVNKWNNEFKKFYLSSQSDAVRNIVVRRALENMGLTNLPIRSKRHEPEANDSIFDREPSQSGVDTAIMSQDTETDLPKPLDIQAIRAFANLRAREDMNLTREELKKEIAEKFPDLFKQYKLAPAIIGKIVSAALRPKIVPVAKERKRKKKYEPQDVLSFDDYLRNRGKRI